MLKNPVMIFISENLNTIFEIQKISSTFFYLEFDLIPVEQNASKDRILKIVDERDPYPRPCQV